ncbi:MAG TPA: YdcF family protein [Bryobacteraceae bacterium]|nr:YdcF family protein [Bryobacteraceae bacterium]
MKHKLRIVLIALALLAIGAILFRESIYRAMAAYLVQVSEPQHADLVVILAGDSAGSRITKAAELVRQGFASQAMVSGPSGTYGFYECDLAIPFAVKKGYPESYFLHEHHDARSTAEEVRVLTGDLRRHGVQRMLLVTSDYHTRRAARLFHAAFPEATLFVVAAPDGHFNVNGWWKDREGRKTFLMEWTKTVTEWFGL